MNQFGFETVSPPIEAQANSKENATLLLFYRLNNPEIRRQVVDMIIESEKSTEGHIMEFRKLDEDGKEMVGPDGEFITERKPCVTRSRESIEAEYDENLAYIESGTRIKFSGTPVSEAVAINWKMPQTGAVATLEQKAIAESHEKGHNIRHYGDEYFEHLFLTCVDPSLIVYSKNDEKLLNKRTAKKMKYAKRDEKSYLFSPKEITERMGQLKNYFGFKADELFTIEHLRYAKEHYVADTGMDNHMTHFFQAIPPEKEQAFVDLMNRAGI